MGEKGKGLDGAIEAFSRPSVANEEEGAASGIGRGVGAVGGGVEPVFDTAGSVGGRRVGGFEFAQNHGRVDDQSFASGDRDFLKPRIDPIEKVDVFGEGASLVFIFHPLAMNAVAETVEVTRYPSLETENEALRVLGQKETNPAGEGEVAVPTGAFCF